MGGQKKKKKRRRRKRHTPLHFAHLPLSILSNSLVSTLFFAPAASPISRLCLAGGEKALRRPGEVGRDTHVKPTDPEGKRAMIGR